MNFAVASQKTPVQKVDVEIDAGFAQFQAFVERTAPLIRSQSALPQQPGEMIERSLSPGGGSAS
jgi:hypothetical protein